MTSAQHVYEHPPAQSGPLPPLPTGPTLGEPVSPHHPSAPPGLDGPGQTSATQPPSPGPLAPGDGVLPVTGWDALLILLAVLGALTLGCALRVASNRRGDW